MPSPLLSRRVKSPPARPPVAPAPEGSFGWLPPALPAVPEPGRAPGGVRPYMSLPEELPEELPDAPEPLLLVPLLLVPLVPLEPPLLPVDPGVPDVDGSVVDPLPEPVPPDVPDEPVEPDEPDEPLPAED